MTRSRATSTKASACGEAHLTVETIFPVLPRDATFSIARGASRIGIRSDTQALNAPASYIA